jgi:hypothetical protein
MPPIRAISRKDLLRYLKECGFDVLLRQAEISREEWEKL